MQSVDDQIEAASRIFTSETFRRMKPFAQRQQICKVLHSLVDRATETERQVGQTAVIALDLRALLKGTA